MPAQIKTGQRFFRKILPAMSGSGRDRALLDRAMPLTDDMQLLQAYVTKDSEEAFKAILDHHVSLVYSTALRQVGSPDLASDVTQTTFIILAKKARSLGPGTILSGWLYRTAQFAATRALRTEARRREREHEAALMQTESCESIWEQLSPILDQAMAHLAAADRDALVLRYFENKTARDVGVALGINEAAAQKRLVRAIEKLRAFCTKKGVVLSGAALAGLLSANAVHAAPAGVCAATTAALKAGASATALTSGTLKLIAWAKLKMAILVGVGVTVVTVGTFAFIHFNTSGPQFHGESLAAWMSQLDNRDRQFSAVLPWSSWQSQWQPSTAQGQAADAVRSMGAAAIPSLIATLEKTNLSVMDRLMGRTHSTIERNHREAAFALDALGPACKPWIPQLAHILKEGPSRKEAAIALAAVGPEGWEALTQALSGKDDDVTCAIWALGSHHAAVPGTEEALMACYQRNSPNGTDIVSLWALTQISPDHAKLIPLLVDGLHAKREDMRWGSAVVLGMMGQETRSALPALWSAMQDKNPTVRHDVIQAIEEIDPQAAVQANLPNALADKHSPKSFF